MTLASYFTSRLQGTASVRTVFWRDMLVTGTIVNAAVFAVSLFYMSRDGNLAVFLLLYLLPMPYNAFILYSVWRCSRRLVPFQANFAKLISLCWFFSLNFI